MKEQLETLKKRSLRTLLKIGEAMGVVRILSKTMWTIKRKEPCRMDI